MKVRTPDGVGQVIRPQVVRGRTSYLVRGASFEGWYDDDQVFKISDFSQAPPQGPATLMGDFSDIPQDPDTERDDHIMDVADLPWDDEQENTGDPTTSTLFQEETDAEDSLHYDQDRGTELPHSGIPAQANTRLTHSATNQSTSRRIGFSRLTEHQDQNVDDDDVDINRPGDAGLGLGHTYDPNNTHDSSEGYDGDGSILPGSGFEADLEVSTLPSSSPTPGTGKSFETYDGDDRGGDFMPKTTSTLVDPLDFLDKISSSSPYCRVCGNTSRPRNLADETVCNSPACQKHLERNKGMDDLADRASRPGTFEETFGDPSSHVFMGPYEGSGENSGYNKRKNPLGDVPFDRQEDYKTDETPWFMRNRPEDDDNGRYRDTGGYDGEASGSSDSSSSGNGDGGSGSSSTSGGGSSTAGVGQRYKRTRGPKKMKPLGDHPLEHEPERHTPGEKGLNRLEQGTKPTRGRRRKNPLPKGHPQRTVVAGFDLHFAANLCTCAFAPLHSKSEHLEILAHCGEVGCPRCGSAGDGTLCQTCRSEHRESSRKRAELEKGPEFSGSAEVDFADRGVTKMPGLDEDEIADKYPGLAGRGIPEDPDSGDDNLNMAHLDQILTSTKTAADPSNSGAPQGMPMGGMQQQQMQIEMQVEQLMKFWAVDNFGWWHWTGSQQDLAMLNQMQQSMMPVMQPTMEPQGPQQEPGMMPSSPMGPLNSQSKVAKRSPKVAIGPLQYPEGGRPEGPQSLGDSRWWTQSIPDEEGVERVTKGDVRPGDTVRFPGLSTKEGWEWNRVRHVEPGQPYDGENTVRIHLDSGTSLLGHKSQNVERQLRAEGRTFPKGQKS